MRVLVLSNLYPPDCMGGYEMGCQQVAGALAEVGHDVLVLTSVPRLPVAVQPGVRRALQLTDVYTRIFVDRQHPAKRVLDHAAACWVNAFNVHALLAVLDEFRPEVAYVWNLIGLGGLGLLGCLQHQGIAWLWHLMDKVPRDLCRLPFPGAAGRLARAAGHYLDGEFLACSRRILDEIEQDAPLLRGEFEIVPNWIEGPLPPPRRSFYRGGRLRAVSAAAHLCAEKGTDLILHAAALLRGRGYDFTLDLFGRLDDDAFPRLAGELGLAECVRFAGSLPREQLVERYAEYDVFVFPTWEREPCAFAPVEAASRGCVPVLTANCGNSEWLVHGVHCLKAERTPEAFAAILDDVVAGRIDLAPLGRRAQALVGREYHLRAVLPAIERALARAAGRRKPPLGTAAQAYHLAVLAEKLTQTMLQEVLAG
jgi:glycosyltransferase involved in cell wall biosynthesis